MPPLSPISRRALIVRLRAFGFNGPYAGGNHEYMIKGAQRLTLPNPHQSDIGSSLLARLLKQAGITRDEWEGEP